MLACCEDQKAKYFLFLCTDEAQLLFFLCLWALLSHFTITNHDEVTVSVDEVTVQSTS